MFLIIVTSIPRKHKDEGFMSLEIRNGNNFPTKFSKQTLQSQRNYYDET